ncbi:Cell cycle serine/threonine-protein kinase cdc5/MSD2, partial [Coelomomyces lativittatus]
GGFARCYEIKDESGRRLAAKVVARTSLVNKKHRDKLGYEIRIHSKMNHFNIVQYERSFADAENIYLIMELCKNK